MRDGTALEHVIVDEGDTRRRIAVRVRDGASPAIVWLGGFRSDMGATKAMAVDAWAASAGRRFVRFDYSGHGESEGEFSACTISTWLADAQAVLAAHAADAPVLIGSSMGGWIACLAARTLVTRGELAPTGLVLIAPALDFTEDLMWARMDGEARAALARDGVYHRPSDYAPEPDPITRALIEDGRANRMLDRPVAPGCPVHILQGMRDADVPYAHALRIVGRLPADGTVLTLIADGDHRLSRPQDIARLLSAVAETGRALSAG